MLAQYAAKLTEGHKALLQDLSGLQDDRLPDAPQRGRAGQRGYEATKHIATSASLVPGGNGVTGALGGTPFPIPKSGLEVYWNHLLRYRGIAAGAQVGQVAPDGRAAATRWSTSRKSSTSRTTCRA